MKTERKWVIYADSAVKPRVRVAAATEGVTLGEWVEEAIRQRLEAETKRRRMGRELERRVFGLD